MNYVTGTHEASEQLSQRTVSNEVIVYKSAV